MQGFSGNNPAASGVIPVAMQSSFHPLLQPLLTSGRLPSLVAQLNRVVLAEEEQRRDFYAWLDEDKKAEFILGEIVIHSPARLAHIQALDNLHFLLRDFVKKNFPGSYILPEQALVRLERSDVMPDLAYWNAEKAAGLVPDTKLFPVPDFVVELLSPSTEKYDRGAKMQEYAANGIAEYWITDPDKKTIEQYVLQHDTYRLEAIARPGESLSALILSPLSVDPAAVFEF